MSKQPGHFYEFGSFWLDARERLLIQDGKPVVLASKTFEALLVLVRNAGHLVEKEDLLTQLWPGTFVEEANLAKHISLLRKALGETGNGQEYIETIPKYGYRFVAQVFERDGTPSAAEVPPVSESPRNLNSEFIAPATSGEQKEPVVSRRSEIPLVSLQGAQTSVASRRWKLRLIIGVAAVGAMTAVGFGVYLWSSRGPALRLEDIQIKRLTDSGRAEDVAISPDGRYVAYARSDGEKQSLWVRQVVTRSEVQILPPDTMSFHGMTFSPDGNYIYFVRTDKNDPLFKYLYVMPALGGPARQMIADVDSPVSFSPDGRQFAFERGVASRNVVELRIANVDGSGDRVLTTIQDGDVGLYQPGPNWSRDGRTVVAPFRMIGKRARWVLASISVSDGSAREIYSSPAPLGRPVWLLGGRSLLVPHYDPAYQRMQLWKISYPGGMAQQFTNDLADYDPQLDMTRDGKTVAAITSTGISNIWVAPAADPLKARQITSGELPIWGIAEAAGGKLLSARGDGGLWLMNSDGSQLEPLVDTQDASWLAPCGHFIVFGSYEAGTVTLTRVNADGSHPINLVSGDLSGPACSPDGKFVFYVNGHQPQKIWRMSIEGGSPVDIAAGLGEGNGRLGISPDGTLLAYVFDQYPPAVKIAVIPVTGGPPIKTFKVPGGIGCMRWSPDGKGLQYLVIQNGAANIWEQPLAGGEPRQLTKFTSGLIFDFNWSSDGKRLLMTRGSGSSDVILLSNFR
jgi:eukaryotic-like serine/threonine-protein kinase